jgi:NTP pyrophosphatase (non-canonical NTP hydrolase)
MVKLMSNYEFIVLYPVFFILNSKYMLDIKKIQQELYNNRIAKGFNTTDINLHFNLTYGELAEAFDAYKKKLPTLGEELADVAIYLFGLAGTLNIDLEDEILKKVEINKKRKYTKVNGVNVRTEETKK